MANRWQIQMDFTRAKQKADELEAIAKELSNLSGNDLQNTLDGIGSDWKSDASTAYLRKGMGLQEKMNKTADSIRNTANTIRAIAQNIYDAEMEALRSAEEREAAARRAAEEAAERARRILEESQRTHGGGGRRF